jgi:hypothetical protein
MNLWGIPAGTTTICPAITSNASAPIYVPGRTQQETERLQQQARLFEPFTRRMLEAAGITAGMKVLDVGSGELTIRPTSKCDRSPAVRNVFGNV